MAYLFDTDAISEVLRRRPALSYARWLRTVPRGEQFTSAVVIGELFKGAFRSPNTARHLAGIEKEILPALTVLPYDVPVARLFGHLKADLERRGHGLADADVQIAATAIQHDLELVSGNLRHFARVPGLRLSRVLAATRPP